jgi:DNA-binding NarL/FixJ family response regulator
LCNKPLAWEALGYIVKSQAANDLWAAVEAVCDGKQFISGGFSGQYFTDESQPPVAIKQP